MAKKILQIFINIILILIPFFPLTENLFPKVDNENFTSYLFACIVIAISMIAMAIVVFKSNVFATTSNMPAKAGWILFSLGIIVLVPLHMGAPAEGPALLSLAALEKFRYGMLLLAVIVFAAGIITAFLPQQYDSSIAKKAILLPLVAAFLLSAWDYYDSYTFSNQLSTWLNNGKTMDSFYSSFDFHMNWRAAGRILLYLTASWLCIILAGKSVIKTWSAVIICIFSLAGISCCIAAVMISLDFYFPFMVPAIALAPAYWLGIILLNRVKQ